MTFAGPNRARQDEIFYVYLLHDERSPCSFMTGWPRRALLPSSPGVSMVIPAWRATEGGEGIQLKIHMHDGRTLCRFFTGCLRRALLSSSRGVSMVIPSWRATEGGVAIQLKIHMFFLQWALYNLFI